MGFAVVADEVRSLAHRSAQAAKDTAGLIEASIAKSSEGQQRVQLVKGAMESITGSTLKVKRLIDEVSEASHQQAQGIDQVSQAIAQMEKVTQGTAAAAEERRGQRGVERTSRGVPRRGLAPGGARERERSHHADGDRRTRIEPPCGGRGHDAPTTQDLGG